MNVEPLPAVETIVKVFPFEMIYGLSQYLVIENYSAAADDDDGIYMWMKSFHTRKKNYEGRMCFARPLFIHQISFCCLVTFAFAVTLNLVHYSSLVYFLIAALEKLLLASALAALELQKQFQWAAKAMVAKWMYMHIVDV